MNIRDASFWKDIEPIFLTRESQSDGIAFHSAGTKYCDYRVLMDRCEHGLRRAARSGRDVMLLKIRFRKIGNRLGENDAGVMDLACQRVCSCLRSCDSASRLDDDTVAILMEDVAEPGLAALVIEKLHTAIAPSLRIGDRQVELGLCVGVAFHPLDRGGALQLWRLASLRVGQAFENCTDAEASPQVVAGHTAMEHYIMIRELHKAYRNDEFSVVYQPVFDMNGRTLVGVEALLRWRHKQRGELHPSAFLGLLEDSGLIVPVGEKVLRDACQFISEMQKAGHDGIRVCVNVSGRQVEDSGFILAVLDAIYDAGIAPASLQIELSETVLAEHSNALLRLLPEIRNAGVSIAVDHFGVTELSLADLVRLPVSLIKMDRSLVGGIVDDAVAQAIASGATAFARGAGIDVAAVGVEADAQLGVLGSMGCKEAQGSWLSQPRPAAGFLDAVTD